MSTLELKGLKIIKLKKKKKKNINPKLHKPKLV